MKKQIILLLLFCAILCNTAQAYGVWPQSAITSSQPTSDGSGVRIAVIDTGISKKHLNTDRIEAGQNYVYPDNSTDDLIGHGTAIAGILLGSEDMGIEGVAPGVTLVPLVCYTKNASGDTESGGVIAMTQAIYDAVDVYDCQIINLSVGLTVDSEDLRTAVAYAETQGVVFISSVGNENKTAPDRVYYPAAYDTVLGVGAIGKNGKVSDFSQRHKSVFLTAPGTDLQVVTIRESNHPMTASGTSFATAFVTGAAALLLSKHPELSPVKVRHDLSSSALDIEATGYDAASGWGVIQLDKALAYSERVVSFRDVPKDSWYAQAVSYVVDRGLFGGTSDRDFSPNTPMTRAMLVTVLYRMAGLPVVTASNSFADVSEGSYYGNAVYWATENGIVSGYGNGVFDSNGSVTRQQLVTMLYRYSQYSGSDLEQVTDSISGYADANEVSVWAKVAMSWAVSEGLIEGLDNRSLAPNNAATRAQVAAILMRFCS